MRVIVHDAVKSAHAPKPFVLLWESIRSAIWILLAAVLVMTGESAMARGSVTTVLDDFSTLRAWSTMRDDARMKVEYASWQMVVDRDGRSGPCLRLSFSPRTNSADIWGAFNIEEPIDGIGLWVQNVTRRPCGFATPSIVMATSPPILYPIIPRLTHVRLLASGDYRYLLEYCIRKKY